MSALSQSEIYGNAESDDGDPLFEPVASSGQLGINNEWTEVSQGVIGDLYEYVYRLIEPLQSGKTSPPLMQGLKMVDMGIEEFSSFFYHIKNLTVI